ncbi:Kalirin [Dirofilaria immitis]|nr:Kalirin [Dirofilaria immitis]
MRDGCPKAEDILHVLRDRVALLPGTRDRNGRAVIIFPARENTAPINSDYIRNILIYLHAVTADDYKDRGFTIIIDMRKGTTWNNVKPILKCIQEHFPAEVHAVLIIKPDKFWEKHKTSVSSGKYKFDIQMISVEGLMRYVDSSQLTRDLGGSLFYDHDEWLEIRMELERLIWQTIDIMHNFENFREEIKNGEMPIDVATAERATSAHVRQRISGSSNGTHEDSCDLSNEPTANPDLAAALPNLASLINSLLGNTSAEARSLLSTQAFEQDADKMFDWIRSHYALSTQRLLEIGDSEQSTSMLLTEHLDFIAAANNTEVNVSHVMTVAKRLREIGNYGKVQIENVAMHLDEEWRRFKQINDQRSRLLDLALSFHRKSHIYLSNTPSWLHNITLDNSRRMGQYSGDELEAAIAEHERFGEIFLQTYAEAIGDGRSLTQILKTVANDAVGQNNAYKHVVDLIQQITRAHKELHSQWQAKKLRLHSRLALIAFETDTHRVLQWLEEHGDAYLNKNTAIGNNLSQAKSECDIQQMSVVVEELRRRIEAFSAKPVRFCFDKRPRRERRKEEWMIESDATAQAYATTMGEGNQLIRALEQQAKMMNIDNRETVSVIERLINDIEQRHAKLADRWPHQRRSLQLGVKFAAFIKDCRQIIQQLKNWREDMLALVKSNNFAERAEHILPYQDDNTTQVKNAVTGVKNNAAELLQALRDNESTLVNTEGILATDVIITSLQQLTDCQREVMQVAQETHHRIEQCMQFNRARAMAAYEETKLLHMNTIPTSLEEALAAQAVHKQFQHAVERLSLWVFCIISGSLANRSLGTRISRTTSSFLNKTDQLISNGGVDVRSVDDLNEEVLNRWRRLVGVTEERNKLIKAGVVCYKTLHQGVMPILDQLEKEYSISSKDWCQIRTGEDAKDRAHHMSSLLSKHMEYKESTKITGLFIWTKTSEMFLKYIRRCEASSEHIRLHETRLLALKENLRKRQMKILDLWMRKKQQLDRCHEACLLEATAAENAEWIGIEGEAFLKRCLERQLNIADRESLEAYMDEYMTFKAEAKVSFSFNNSKTKRLKVRMMLELAEKFLSTLDHHCNAIERKMFDVRSSYEDFSMRLANYENLLSEALGRKLDVNKAKDEFSLDRKSDSNIEAKIEVERLANEEKRKMREPMMELIKSEKDYIEDLHKCIKYYLNAYHAANDTLPFAIRDKEKEIFSNIEQLYKFHNEIFLPELIKHENDPEDVGYCFIFSVEMLNTLYTEYCVNKEQNNYIIALPEAMQFFRLEIRERNGLEHSQDLSSLVIKPVQRITRYRLMLEQLLKNCKNNVDEIKEAYDVVVSVPRRANDLMHLGNFENYEKLGVLGDFVMQESFLVWDPKAYFKRGENGKFSCLSSALYSPRKRNYQLAEINVCEHVEGDSSKFALRQGNEPNTEMRTELKATNEQCKVHWVKKIRELMQGLMTANFDMRQIPARNSGTTTTTSVSDRTSKDSDSLPTSNEDRNSLRSCASSNSNHNLELLKLYPALYFTYGHYWL